MNPFQDAFISYGRADSKQFAQTLSERLKALGYTVQSRQVADVAPAVALSATSSVSTSSSALATTAMARTSTTAPPALPSVQVTLAEQATLRELLDTSTAQTVLVVRAVIVDGFQLIRGNAGVNQQQLIGAGDDANQGVVGAEEVIAAEGRIVVGQAFLYDVRSKLRIWSRQLPDYPEDGRLLENHPQLSYGYVRGPNEPPLKETAKASRAATAFTSKMLGAFPPSQPGEPGARDALANLDAGAERRLQKRLDRSTWSLEADIGWGVENIDNAVSLNDDAVMDTVDLPGSAAGSAGALPIATARRITISWGVSMLKVKRRLCSSSNRARMPSIPSASRIASSMVSGTSKACPAYRMSTSNSIVRSASRTPSASNSPLVCSAISRSTATRSATSVSLASFEKLRAVSVRICVVASPNAHSTPGETGETAGQLPISFATALTWSGPAPPTPITANSRGS